MEDNDWIETTARYISDKFIDCDIRIRENDLRVDTYTHPEIGGFSLMWTDTYGIVLTVWENEPTPPAMRAVFQCPVTNATFHGWAVLNDMYPPRKGH